MILLIDNYDSFSYNLYQLIGEINPDIKVIRNDEMTVDEEHSGRLISTYLDEPYDIRVVDYQGKCYNGREESGVHMEPSPYHLKMSAEYLALLLGTYVGEDGII